MDRTPPLTVVVFICADGAVSHKGVLVTRECCPDIKWLVPERLYVLTSSTRQDATSGRHFLHLSNLSDVFHAIRDGALSGVTEVRFSALRRNPWLQRPNESKTTAKKRRKRVAAALRTLMAQLVANDSEKQRCVCFSSRAVTWMPMEMGTGVGLVGVHETVPSSFVWGRHEFDSALVSAVMDVEVE
jgi:hypothetical protein